MNTSKLLIHLASLRDLIESLPDDPKSAATSLQFVKVSLTLAIDAFGGEAAEAPAKEAKAKSSTTKAAGTPWDHHLVRKDGTMRAHGTLTAYQRGCRCDRCKGAQRVQNKSRQVQKKAEAQAMSKPMKGKAKATSEEPAPAHGTVEGFHEHATRRETPCAPCWSAWKKWIPEIPAEPEAPPPAPTVLFKSIPHGTISGYKTHKCRCDLCRKANRDAAKRTKANRAAQGDLATEFVHGANGYRNHGCRCDICTAGSTEATRKWRATHQRSNPVKPEVIVVAEAPAPPSPKPVPEIQHGTRAGYTSGKCRCDLCKAANTQACKETRERRLARLAAGETFKHGLSGYNAYKCRCDICKAAKTEEQQRRRASREIKHGTRSTYVYHGCRCDLCTAANSERARALREVRVTKAAAGEVEVPHGRTGYIHYGCRCQVCVQAETDHRSSRSQKFDA